MLSKKINEALNIQLNREFSAAWLYFSMAAQTARQNLKGFTYWLELQAEEETGHGKCLYQYIIEQDGEVCFLEIAKPKNDWNSLISLFNAALKHEQKVSQKIQKLYTLTLQEEDFATSIFLQKFIMEQVEEESQFRDILQRLKTLEDSPEGIFLMDAELAKRKPSEF